MHASSNILHPVFQETLRGFVRASRIASKILSEAELIESYGISPYATQERCESCNQSHPSEDLVRTLDGPTCADCMEIQRQQAEEELAEVA